MAGRGERMAESSADVRLDHERIVEAELWKDLRPLRVRVRERSTWRRAGAELGTSAAEQVYTFEWDAPPDTHLPRLFPDLDPSYQVRFYPPYPQELGAAARDPALARDRLQVRAWGPGAAARDVVDVLVIGDGYVAADLGDTGAYASDVERILAGLFAEPPFSWYREAFAVRALFLESRQSGCDADAALDDVDTALDVRHWGENGLRVHDMERLYGLVAAAGGADLVLVLVNTDRSAGLEGLRVATVSARTSDAARIAAHEVGHAFADLGHDCADAVLATPIPAGATSFEAYRERETTKWGHFLRLPGAERFERSREGERYRGRWRVCRMQSCDEPFCPVCSEILARAIHEECGLPWDDDAHHEAHPLALWAD